MNSSYFFSVYGGMKPLVIFVTIFDLFLRGVALYKSGKREQKVWFVFLLLVNSMGILPFIYLVINKDVFNSANKVVATKTVKSKKTKK